MHKADKNIGPSDYDLYYSRVGNLKDDRANEILSLCPVVDSVLDLGGGTGNVSGRLDGNITIVDWSPVAETLVENPKVEYIRQDIVEFLATTKRKFDLVILADVIEEMKESQTRAVIDGVNRVAQKYLVISTPTHENYLNMATHQVIYSKQELLDMLPEWGMVREIEYRDRLVALFERR